MAADNALSGRLKVHLALFLKNFYYNSLQKLQCTSILFGLSVETDWFSTINFMKGEENVVVPL